MTVSFRATPHALNIIRTHWLRLDVWRSACLRVVTSITCFLAGASLATAEEQLPVEKLNGTTGYIVDQPPQITVRTGIDGFEIDLSAGRALQSTYRLEKTDKTERWLLVVGMPRLAPGASDNHPYKVVPIGATGVTSGLGGVDLHFHLAAKPQPADQVYLAVIGTDARGNEFWLRDPHPIPISANINSWLTFNGRPNVALSQKLEDGTKKTVPQAILDVVAPDVITRLPGALAMRAHLVRSSEVSDVSAFWGGSATYTQLALHPLSVKSQTDSLINRLLPNSAVSFVGQAFHQQSWTSHLRLDQFSAGMGFSVYVPQYDPLVQIPSRADVVFTPIAYENRVDMTTGGKGVATLFGSSASAVLQGIYLGPKKLATDRSKDLGVGVGGTLYSYPWRAFSGAASVKPFEGSLFFEVELPLRFVSTPLVVRYTVGSDSNQFYQWRSRIDLTIYLFGSQRSLWGTQFSGTTAVP